MDADGANFHSCFNGSAKHIAEKHQLLAFYLLLVAFMGFLFAFEAFELSFGHGQLLLYAAPVAVVVYLLTPAAGLLWAGIAALIILARIILFAEKPVEFGVWFGQLSGFGIITALLWLLGRLQHDTEAELKRHIQQGQASTEIGHTVTANISEAATIIQQVVVLIQEAFEYYHVSFFEYDAETEVATLTTAAGGM